MIRVSIGNQSLRAVIDGAEQCFPVSTAKNGPGEQEGSGCTPRGRHRIREKIGDQVSVGTVFVGRVPTGEVYSAELGRSQPHRDWVLSRILWLDGLEHGYNRGCNSAGSVDSHARYIYIHGTNEEHLLGQPASHGCIRMANADVIALFDAVSVGDEVIIDE